MKDPMELQRAEFNAVDELTKQWRRLQLTAIVDDDYPVVRYDYESALHSLIEALNDNGRFDPNSQGGLIFGRKKT